MRDCCRWAPCACWRTIGCQPIERHGDFRFQPADARRPLHFSGSRRQVREAMAAACSFELMSEAADLVPVGGACRLSKRGKSIRQLLNEQLDDLGHVRLASQLGEVKSSSFGAV